MKIKLICLLLLGGTLLINCKSLSSQHLKNFNWLLGTWENKTETGPVYETWRKLNPNEFKGKSYTLKGNDTIVFESIKLLQEDDQLFYIPTVKNQNDEKPVKFVMKTITDSSVKFENPKHDFPQVIQYKRIKTDSMVAEILGIKNDLERNISFPMKRIK